MNLKTNKTVWLGFFLNLCCVLLIKRGVRFMEHYFLLYMLLALSAFTISTGNVIVSVKGAAKIFLPMNSVLLGGVLLYPVGMSYFQIRRGVVLLLCLVLIFLAVWKKKETVGAGLFGFLLLNLLLSLIFLCLPVRVLLGIMYPGLPWI